MKVICVSGSVGTGKTTIAKKLAKALDYRYIDVNRVIKKHKLSEAYDKKRKCKVIDVKKLNKVIIATIKALGGAEGAGGQEGLTPGVIIDSHMSHLMPKRYVDLCIITKCDLKTMERRLKKRRYSQQKVKENLECEIFDVCLEEAKQKKHNILTVDTTKRPSVRPIVSWIKHME